MPSENYLLSNLSDVAITKTDDTDKTKLRTFTGIANSGLPFSYHGERAIVDMSTITLSDKVPVLSKAWDNITPMNNKTPAELTELWQQMTEKG